MTDKEWNQRLMLCLELIYESGLDLLSESEYNKWMEFLQTDSVMQSSTKQDDFIEWLKELESRISKEKNNLIDNRSELSTILNDFNIDTDIN